MNMVHFLVDASMPRATAELIRTFGHQATDVRDIELGSAADAVIARHARENRLCIVTRDRDFGNILDYPPGQYAGLVVLRTPEVAPRSVVLAILESFLQQTEIVEQISGRLAVVEPNRIRVRSA